MVVEPYTSEKYEFVNGKDDIPYILEKMFQTTSQAIMNITEWVFLEICYLSLIMGFPICQKTWMIFWGPQCRKRAKPDGRFGDLAIGGLMR